MANLNVKRLTPHEAARIRGAARGRRETMKEYVLNSGNLRADLGAAVRALLDAGLPVPACAFARAAEAKGDGGGSVGRHIEVCPVCAAAAVQRLFGATPALGWLDLAGDIGLSSAELPLLNLRFVRLPARDRAVLTGLYGLDAKPRETLAGIGAALGISRERVRQVAERAKTALRAETGALSVRDGSRTRATAAPRRG